jgi:hypothetical protein
MLPQGPRRYAPHGLACADVLPSENAAFTADDRFDCDAGLFSNTGLAADDGVIADRDAAGETGLRSDDDMLADVAIVRDVNEIIELDAVGDAGDAEGRSIDAAVSADLDVVADLDGANLWELFVTVSGQSEAEAIGAENASGMHNDASTDMDGVVDGYVCMYCGSVFNDHALADAAAVANGAAMFDARFVANDDVSTDETVGSNGCGRRDDGSGVNCRSRARLGI